MTDTATVHRMADPTVRLRVFALLAALVALSWSSVALLGRDAGAFSERELPDVAGLPILVPQIERLLPPPAAELPGGVLPSIVAPTTKGSP